VIHQALSIARQPEPSDHFLQTWPQLILTAHSGSHDAGAALFEDYNLLAAVQLERLTREWRKRIAAVVHVDGSGRPQIIERETNPLYYDILNAFERESGLPVLVNTSFNVH
jgi:predicted NodU family carbamoyl transferase